MKADNTRFYISPITDGGYLLEKFQNCTLVERCMGSYLTPDEVAKSLETKGFKNISISKAPISSIFAKQCIKNSLNIPKT